ncbi:MAG TPA: DUF4331 domain-containing protein [Solirubrobacteraceae bacterium]|jgi:hypothetical protein|nr:DUF4331 domain-containing protein [Solirubrobacteraceae bacterium]
MSSHREAPGTSQDPVADSTDVYAFVSPDDPSTVTLICNYIPLEGPAAGPNFYEFGDDVLYSLHIANKGTAQPDVTYDFEFQTKVVNPNTFLYNTGPISALDDPHFNKRQFYSVTRTSGGRSTVLATGLASPPCNIGPLSTPSYSALAQAAVHSLPGGRKVFAGQRAEGFYVDLGAVFDLGDLRPFENLHAFGNLPARDGVNATAKVNVHTIALKVPISDLVAGSPTIGVWATASRKKVQLRGVLDIQTGPWVQVSRLGNPLFNEVLVPLGKKDRWNASTPSGDSAYAAGVAHPELAGLLNVLYPGVFPNLAGYRKPRADLLAILLTGIPKGVVSPTYTTFTGAIQADMLRLNTSIPPTTANPSVLGVLGGDLAGFPNGRRVFDDVFTIELRAIAGVTIPLVDPSFTPDGAAAVVTDGLTFDNYLPAFPYLGVPYAGYDVP